jgi:adenylate cyclase class 2
MPMPKTTHRQEIEIKLRVADLGALRARLNQLRAREISPRTYESNTLYDTVQHTLRRRGQLLRIRIERPARNSGKACPNGNARTILTYKGPSPSRRSARAGRLNRAQHSFKIREEAEVVFAGADDMIWILRGLRLHPVFRYEKFRTTYALAGLRGLKLELDETPLGTFLELEGPRLAIRRAARLLGYGPEAYITATYGSLYLAECRRRGRRPGDMLFSPTKILR